MLFSLDEAQWERAVYPVFYAISRSPWILLLLFAREDRKTKNPPQKTGRAAQRVLPVHTLNRKDCKNPFVSHFLAACVQFYPQALNLILLMKCIIRLVFQIVWVEN